MQIQKVSLTNFLSFGQASLTLPANGLVLVTGWDEDLGRANGAGKSSLFQALAWCLYGELPRDIKVDELIRRGESSCSVTVDFLIEDIPYSVTRKRPSALDLSIGGQKQKGNPKYVQALIEQAVGLSYKQFLITSYFPQRGDSSRFIKQNDATAKDFLSTILNFNKTEAAYKRLHFELKEAEILASSKAAEVAALESSLASLRVAASNPLPPKPDKAVIMAVKNELDLVQVSTKDLPDTTMIDSDIAKVQQAVQKVAQARFDVSNAKQQIADLQRKHDHVLGSSEAHDDCPHCSEPVIKLNGRLVAFDEAAAEDVKNSKLNQMQEEIAAKQQVIAKMSPLVEKEAAFQVKLDELKSKRMQARHDYDLAVQRKSHLLQQMGMFKQAMETHNVQVAHKAKVDAEIHSQQMTLVEKKVQLQLLERDVLLIAASKAVLSPTGAIAYSLESVMGDLNNEVGQYLDIFSHNTMTYQISSGDDKAKVTHNITKDGVNVSVGSLSGGEERGLIISVDLGLSEVIASRSGVSLPSILLLDEAFEGLDYVGKEKVIDALRQISQTRCIIVVDHSTEFNALFDQSIKVVKKNGSSSLVTE